MVQSEMNAAKNAPVAATSPTADRSQAGQQATAVAQSRADRARHQRQGDAPARALQHEGEEFDVAAWFALEEARSGGVAAAECWYG